MNRPLRPVPPRLAVLLVAVSLLAPACTDDTALGIAVAVLPGQAPGPLVVWEPLHQPDPELPFPNDAALHLRADGTTRLNLSTQAPTEAEQRQRRHTNEVEGFSGLTPITVSFEGPLDLATVTDDSVFVVNIQPGSRRSGEVAALDLGRGWFPHDAQPHAYFPHDPYKDFNSYVLPPDNLIDSDGDGKPDKWVYHYETATKTLDVRPILPLEAGARYAIVITRKVKGWTKDGKYGPVRSPFAFVNHAAQTEALLRALPVLAKRNVKADDVAFAWTLTTGDLSRTFRALRDGLYGKGAFRWLLKEFPPRLTDVYDTDVTFDGDGSYTPPGAKPFPIVAWDHRYVLQGAYMKHMFGLIGGFAPDVGLGGAFSNVSHVVFGEIEVPNLRATPDNVWQLDVKAGTVDVDPAQFHEKVPWMLVVPKTTAAHKPPFPVAIHAHATGSSRLEGVLLCDQLAQAGIATFAIDAVGHGPVLADPLKFLANALKTDTGGAVSLLRGLLPNLLYADADKRFPEDMPDEVFIEKLLQHGFLQQLAVKGRAVDDDGDCEIKGGEAYFAPDAFRLRDAMRQTTLDNIRAIQVLRSFDPAKVPKPPAVPQQATKAQLMPSFVAGDFDLDGVLDVGGPKVPYFMLGVSLGGIHTALATPLEPNIVAAAPVVPGAGLADIFIRTKLHSIVERLMHVIGGVAVVGCPGKDGKVGLSWNDDADNCSKTKRNVWRDPETGKCGQNALAVPTAFAQVDVPEGATVVVYNLRNGLITTARASKGGGFRAAVASDKGDTIRVEVLGSSGKATAIVTVKTPYEGLGRQRNTPEFRRFVVLAANILEGADAITVADRMITAPLPDHPATNVLMLLGVVDQTVPFASGVSLARAVGLFGRDADPQAPTAGYREWTEKAIAAGLVAGKDGPVPLLDPTKPEGGPGLCRTVASNPGHPGVSALCLADVHGHHEYIAQTRAPNSFPPILANPDGKSPAPVEPQAALAKDGKPFPQGTYTDYHRNLIVTYFHSLGRRLPQDPCWGSAKCVEERGLRAEWDLPLGETAGK